jgi:hypothetical protein
MANSPLNQPTLALIKIWGIQRELVICHHKYGIKPAFFKIIMDNLRTHEYLYKKILLCAHSFLLLFASLQTSDT